MGSLDNCGSLEKLENMKPSLEMLLEYLKSVKDRNFSVEFEVGKLGIGEGDVGKNMNPYLELLLEHFEQVMVHGEDEGFKVDMLMKLARVCDSVPKEILCTTVPIIIKVVDGVGGGSCSSSWSVREASVCCLRRVACVGDGRMANEMGKFGVVHSLLRLLPESEGGFRRVLLRCLWCVVTFGADNRKIVAMNGGLEIVIGMLNSINDDGTRRYLLEILSALALIREVRRALDGSEALIFLVEACLFGSMVSRERACQALGLLGTTRCLRRKLVELGVIPVLVELFRIGDATMKLVAGNSLGVILSDVGNNWPVTEVEVVHMYIELLQGPDSVGREIAEDVFCVLVYGEHNAVLIADYLVGVLREGNDESKIVAAHVFWNLLRHRHKPIPVVVIPVLVNLLSDGDVALREMVSRIVALISHNDADRLALANAGAVPLLRELSRNGSGVLRDNALEALLLFGEPIM